VENSAGGHARSHTGVDVADGIDGDPAVGVVRVAFEATDRDAAGVAGDEVITELEFRGVVFEAPEPSAGEGGGVPS
jgi:hypothetical protein